MKFIRNLGKLSIAALLLSALAGCATYHPHGYYPAHGHVIPANRVYGTPKRVIIHRESYYHPVYRPTVVMEPVYGYPY